MYRQNKEGYSQGKNQCLQNHRVISKEDFVLRARIGIIALLAMFLSATIAGADFYSKEQYAFRTDYNDDYEYQWSSSAGAYLENEGNTFHWTAPDVNTPADVEISVLVTDRSCGCQSTFEKTIKVLPADESKTEGVIYFNNTNLSQSDNDTEILGAFIRDHENSTKVQTLGYAENDIDIDSLPEIQANASEMISIEAISKSMPEISTLSFDDGTKVDVVFAEDSSGDDIAYALLHVNENDINEILSRAEMAQDQAELMAMTGELLAAHNEASINPANITQPDISDIIVLRPECDVNETGFGANSQKPPDAIGEEAVTSHSGQISTIMKPQLISVPVPMDDQSSSAGREINQSISE